jgi:hypothetical protein
LKTKVEEYKKPIFVSLLEVLQASGSSHGYGKNKPF